MLIRVLLMGGLLVLSSCMGVRAKKHTYAATGGSLEVGGAQIGIEFRPEGTKGPNFMMSAMVVGGGFATFDGPFKWRIEGIGTAGEQETLVVHRIRTKTKLTKRDGWYPTEHLGKAATFRPLRGQPGVVRARYPIPGLLQVKPEEDGRLDVWVDLSVRGPAGSQRRTLRFALDPAVKRQDEMVFLPVEVAKSIGRDPADWEDSMWD